MPFDANGNWTQPDAPGYGYTQGGGIPGYGSFDSGMNNGVLVGGAAPPSLGGTPIDMSGNVQQPNAATPPPGWTAPPPGTVIPSTPGDPTHGGMFGPTGYVSPQQQQQNQANNPFAYTNNTLLSPYPTQFSYNSPQYGSAGYGQAQGGGFGYAGAPGGGASASGGGGGGIPPGANPMDPAVIRQWVQQQGMRSGSDQSATNDPNYWVGVIQQHGGLTSDNMGYFGNRITSPSSGGGGGGGLGGGFTPLSPFQFGNFSYSPQQVGGVSAPGAFNMPGQFQFGSLTAPQQYNAQQFQYGQGPGQQLPPGFVAPTLDNTNDPGYAFRIAQGQQQIQNQAAAQGARGGDVEKALQDYTQNTASSEYGNVFNRALGGYQAQLAGQQQGYGQAYNAAALNSQTGLSAAALNAQNALQAYQANYNAAQGVYQTNFQDPFAAWQANAQNQLQASALTEQAQTTNAQLGWQAASGSFDRNYNTAWNAYQSQVQQQLAAAGLGFQYAGLGLQAQNQGFNQALSGYQTNFGNYMGTQQQQYGMLSGQAAQGLNAAGQYNAAAGQYGSNLANLYTGSANAGAAGTVGAGNAWGQAFGNIGNAWSNAGLYAGYGMPQRPAIGPGGTGGVPSPGGYGNPSRPPVYQGGELAPPSF